MQVANQEEKKQVAELKAGKLPGEQDIVDKNQITELRQGFHDPKSEIGRDAGW